jgi:hypothetical protein
VRKGDSNAESILPSPIATEKFFPVESSVRLFFTVIAYDPTSTRAGQFLGLFRHLIPHFCGGGPAIQCLLRDGIEAFANVFSKASATKPKVPFSFDTDAAANISEKGVVEENASVQQSSTWTARREAFLMLVESFFSCGQGMRSTAMRKILDIVRATLKDGTESTAAASFVEHYTESILGPRAAATPKQVLAFLKDVGPLFRAHVGVVDFSPLLDAVSRLQSDPRLVADDNVRMLLVQNFAAPAVEACAAFAAEGAATKLAVRSATVRLVASLATRGDREVVELLCRQKPSAGFLATVILPVCLELDTDAPAFGEGARAHTAWLRLLEYAVAAGERAASAPSSVTGPVAILSIQILKVILVRGERELDATRGSWLFVAHALKRMLATGGSAFLAEASRQASSPRRRGDSDNLPPLPRPTTFDFALWSFCEFLALYRTPLMIHLRTFVREKLVQAREWSVQVDDNFSGSSTKAENAFADRRRASTFLKTPPVRTSSRRWHGASSPRSRRSPSPSMIPQTPTSRRSMSSLSPSEEPMVRRPSFASFTETYLVLGSPRTPSPASSPTRTTFPRIQHLGLAPHGAGMEQLGGGSSSTTVITTPALVRATVTRIEVVQLAMGEQPIPCALLLASLDGGARDDDALSTSSDENRLKSWTRSDALRKTVAEANAVMDEFPGLFAAEG